MLNKVKTVFFFALATVSVFSFAGESVKGEVLDLSCYLTHDAKGEKHRKCAKGCLEKGLPMGVLAENGKVYLLLENHDNADAYATAKKHAAEQVEVKGKIIDKGGLQAVVVESCTKI